MTVDLNWGEREEVNSQKNVESPKPFGKARAVLEGE